MIYSKYMRILACICGNGQGPAPPAPHRSASVTPKQDLCLGTALTNQNTLQFAGVWILMDQQLFTEIKFRYAGMKMIRKQNLSLG